MGAEDWHDPHDLIPEQFREEFGDSETVADALRRAESRPSSTPDSERRCCPSCYSVQIAPKSQYGTRNSPQRIDGVWRCIVCSEHFDEPLNMDPNATQFEWIDPDDIPDAGERSALKPPFATLDEQTRTALAIALCQPWHEAGASYRDAAVFFPHSHYWIGRRVRAWKDGEHRELVPDPTAEPEPITVDEQGGATAVATDGGRRSRWDAYGS